MAKKYTVSKTIEYTGVLPIMIKADGNALLDYRIYGNTIQNGIPTPENPIIPSGCGEKTENLFDVSAYSVGTTNTFITKKITLEPNTTYTMSSNCPLYNNGALIVIGNVGESFTTATTAKNGVYQNHPKTRTTDANGELLIGLRTNGSDYTPTDYDTMLNAGSTPLPYKPYGYKLPILSNSTVTDIYLEEAETTRRIKKLVLTGEEIFTKNNPQQNTDYLYYAQAVNIFPGSMPNTPVLCNELPTASSIPQTEIGINTENRFLVVYFNFGADIMDVQQSGNTVNGLKEYLAAQYTAGTPVTIWYVLAEPETAVVNEPLMNLGDYADTIGSAQTAVQIPTLAGTTVIDYDGTPKPSQMYAKYNWCGWSDIGYKCYHKSPNLIDESVIENGELNPYTGYVSPTPGLSYVTTDFITMLSGTYTISFKALTGWATSGKTLSFAIYDENRQYIEGRRWTLPSATTGESFYYSFRSVQCYIKFCWESDYVEKPMLYLGSDELPYEPYSTEVWHDANEFIRQNGVWVQQ